MSRVKDMQVETNVDNWSEEYLELRILGKAPPGDSVTIFTPYEALELAQVLIQHAERFLQRRESELRSQLEELERPEHQS